MHSSFALKLNNWLDDLQETLSLGQLLYVPSLATPCLGKDTIFGSGGSQYIEEKRGRYIGEHFVHTRANTDTHESQALPDNTTALEHSIHIQPWATPAESLYA